MQSSREKCLCSSLVWRNSPLFPDAWSFTHPSCGKQKWNMEQIKSWNTAQHIRFTIYAALVTESVLLRVCSRKECCFQIGAREETSGAGSLPRKEENQTQIASPHYTEHNPGPAVLHDKSWKWLAPNSEILPLFHGWAHSRCQILLTFIPACNFHCQYHHQSPHQGNETAWIHREVPRCRHGQQEQTWCKVPL